MEGLNYERRENKFERIALPAILFKGKVFLGYAHFAISSRLERDFPETSDANAEIELGYVTSTGRFIDVSSDEVFNIANSAGQLNCFGNKISEREEAVRSGSDFLMDKYREDVELLAELANQKQQEIDLQK